LADLLLFGGFLLWAVPLYVVSRKRDRIAGVRYLTGQVSRDVIAVVVGLVLWVAFALWLHGLLIGVKPFGV
jgi:uncharacterized membrane protein